MDCLIVGGATFSFTKWGVVLMLPAWVGTAKFNREEIARLKEWLGEAEEKLAIPTEPVPEAPDPPQD